MKLSSLALAFVLVLGVSSSAAAQQTSQCESARRYSEFVDDIFAVMSSPEAADYRSGLGIVTP